MKPALQGVPRRLFLYAAGLALLMFFTFRWPSCWRPFLFRPPKTTLPPMRPNPFKEEGKALVSLVHGMDVEKMVREAIHLIGGVDRLDVSGKTVLLKPNILNASPPPATTNPMVIKAVTKILYESGAGQVLVGDMSYILRLPTRKNMKATSIETAVEEVGGKLVPFDEKGWLSVDIPGRLLERVYVTEVLSQVDRIINIPVIKTHRSATYSIALKNFVGATHFRQRPYFVSWSRWEEVIAELNLAYAPDLHIVDGTRLMAEGGPWEGKTVDANLVIATGDRIVADAVGLGVLKHYSRKAGIQEVDVWEQRQLKRAMELGLGVKGKDQIRLMEKDLEPGRADFEAVVKTVRKTVEPTG